jgi:hypothetical protein
VVRYRDVEDFDDRASGYDQGWSGRLHHDIADRFPDADELAGIDAAAVDDRGGDGLGRRPARRPRRRRGRAA